MAVDLSRQKELNADPKAIQQTEFIRQFKNIDGVNTLPHTIYVGFTDFRENQGNETKIFSRKHSSLIKDSKLLRSKT